MQAKKRKDVAVTKMQRPSLQGALDVAPVARSPSLDMATRYPVAAVQRTTHELRNDNMATDFNGAVLHALSFVESCGFPGFPILTQLAQIAEYRAMHERFADECIRMWGKVASSGAADAARVRDLESEFKRLDIRQCVRQMIIHDQAYGGGHAFIVIDGAADLSLPLLPTQSSVLPGSFKGLRVIEPTWLTPNSYNSNDPTKPDFYRPDSWILIGGQTVNALRLPTIISRPVGDMLKPAYSFRGISMTQLAIPYVDNWLRTRQSVSDTVKQFSISGISTDLQSILQPGAGADLSMRADLINRYRDNRNLLFLDKATEEFFQVNTPLSTLDALQAQAQEHMSAVSHIPLVILTGITPAGLNASSEGEIRVFYDYIKGYQYNVLQAFMLHILKIAQLSMFGAIDPDISWEWLPLHELNDLEGAEMRAKEAETDERYVTMGVLSPETVQQRLIADPDSPYAGILESGETLETTPDDDIEQIAAHLASMNQGSTPPDTPEA